MLQGVFFVRYVRHALRKKKKLSLVHSGHGYQVIHYEKYRSDLPQKILQEKSLVKFNIC
jgi:hypothetical protein